MYAITGATGQLGQLVVEDLLRRGIDPASIVAAVRTPDKARTLAAKGVQVREADYERPETLGPAFAGVTKLLLISSSEVGRRSAQHGAAIAAAKAAQVGLIAYTSLLHADTSPLGLAAEHRDTETALASSGVPAVVLRNGWYTENHLGSLPAVLQHNAVVGAAKDGRISSAARADYAAAAAAVLVADGQGGRVYELAGDEAWTLSDLAAAIGRAVGRTIPYVDQSETAYADMLRQAGLPEFLATLLADSDAGAAKGALFDASRTLSGLIGRPTTPMPDTLAAALKALG